MQKGVKTLGKRRFLRRFLDGYGAKRVNAQKDNNGRCTLANKLRRMHCFHGTLKFTTSLYHLDKSTVNSLHVFTRKLFRWVSATRRDRLYLLYSHAIVPKWNTIDEEKELSDIDKKIFFFNSPTSRLKDWGNYGLSAARYLVTHIWSISNVVE